MSIRVEILENKTRYCTSDILAWIDEMQWYVEKIESYAPQLNPEYRGSRNVHVKISNYASHDVGNRFKQEWNFTGCVHATDERSCPHEHAELKWINPERLVPTSVMGHLSNQLQGNSRIADLELMHDFSNWVARALMWGFGSDEAVSGMWSRGWRIRSESMYTALIDSLHEAGLGIGTEGKPTWNHELAQSIRHDVLQSVIPIIDKACLESTTGKLEHLSRECAKLVRTYQSLRDAHRANDTHGEVRSEEYMRNSLEVMTKLLAAVK
jgi:hypothetical protein